MDPAALRAAFPVFERLAYLNAGTCGPVPQESVRAQAQAAEAGARTGRTTAYFEQLQVLRERQRASYAALIGARPEDVALQTSTSEGIVRVLLGLGLGPGDEVLTVADEHPGLLGPLAAARERLGLIVRTATLAELPFHVGPRTGLIACSHVAWTTGEVAPAALAEVGRDVPVLLDGAQGAGAVPVDAAALGCAFYAAAGQKWLCGPVGTGFLYVAAPWRERLAAIGPTYLALADPASGLDASPHPDARAHDASALGLEALAGAAAAFATLAEEGWDAVHRRAVALAGSLADALQGQGRTVAPRGESTLVAWEDPAPEQTKDGLAQAGVVVRDLPGTPYLRASVGAWNDEEDLQRLLSGLA